MCDTFQVLGGEFIQFEPIGNNLYLRKQLLQKGKVGTITSPTGTIFQHDQQLLGDLKYNINKRFSFLSKWYDFRK